MASSTILSKASAWRAKYISQGSSTSSRTAVVVGATSGIGQAISHRLAEQGWSVVAVGRHREGRPEAIVQRLQDLSPNPTPTTTLSSSPSTTPKHEFVACDCFSLKSVRNACQEIQSKHERIDALVLTQGMATTQGFTPTSEGNDEKLTLHYFSRMAFCQHLLSSLQKSDMPKGAVVLSVLSAGVHSPYKHFESDFSLQKNYSIKNAADAAGYYTDLGMDALALENPDINFVHAAPGFINTNWGTEFHPILRGMVRLLQPLGRSASDCAEFMAGPTVLAGAYNDPLPPRTKEGGMILMGEKGQPASTTTEHTPEARDFVWNKTLDILRTSAT